MLCWKTQPSVSAPSDGTAGMLGGPHSRTLLLLHAPISDIRVVETVQEPSAIESTVARPNIDTQHVEPVGWPVAVSA